jgi:hypothetical protein
MTGDHHPTIIPTPQRRPQAPTQPQTRARGVNGCGVVGQAKKKPIGTYTYFKRREAHFDVCRVDVYLLVVKKQLKTWREKDQREARWFTLDEAADMVQEPGLVALFRSLGSSW